MFVDKNVLDSSRKKDRRNRYFHTLKKFFCLLVLGVSACIKVDCSAPSERFNSELCPHYFDTRLISSSKRLVKKVSSFSPPKSHRTEQSQYQSRRISGVMGNFSPHSQDCRLRYRKELKDWCCVMSTFWIAYSTLWDTKQVTIHVDEQMFLVNYPQYTPVSRVIWLLSPLRLDSGRCPDAYGSRRRS